MVVATIISTDLNKFIDNVSCQSSGFLREKPGQIKDKFQINICAQKRGII